MRCIMITTSSVIEEINTSLWVEMMCKRPLLMTKCAVIAWILPLTMSFTLDSTGGDIYVLGIGIYAHVVLSVSGLLELFMEG